MQKLNRLGKKRVLFLSIVLFLTIAPIFMRPSYAHLNNDGSAREKIEGGPSEYRFIAIATRKSNYGTHDWIADAALLVIQSSIEYRQNPRILDWLLDPYDQINWKVLDGIQRTNQRNGWFGPTKIRGSGLTNELWLRARRKGWFLYGTAFADKTVSSRKVDQTYREIGAYAPTEVFYMYNKRYFNAIGQHHIYIDGEGNLDLKNDKESRLAYLAARDAIEFLNKKHTLKQKSTGQSYDKYGSYEPAAFLIGMVAHFVSDLSSSPHTLPKLEYGAGYVDWYPEYVDYAHANWETFTDNQMDPEFSVPLNGPIGSLISRTDIRSLAYGLTLLGKRPDIAARDLARFTRNGFGDNFGHTLDYDPIYYSQNPADAPTSEKLIYKNVVKYTLKRAVLETANAILWVLMQVDWDKHGNTDDYDTVGRLIGDFEEVATEAVRHDPVPAAEIPNTMQGWTPFKPSTAGMTLSTSAVSMLVILAPLIAIALIPVAEKVLEVVVKN